MEIWPRHDDFLIILYAVASPEPHFVFTCTQSLNNPPSLWCPTPDGNLSSFCWRHIPFWHLMRNYKAQSGRVRCFWLSVSFFFVHWQPAQFICFTGRRDATLTNQLITQLVTAPLIVSLNLIVGSMLLIWKLNFQSPVLANPRLSPCSLTRVSLRTRSNDIPDNFVQNPRQTTYQSRPRLWLSQNRCPRTGVRTRDSWWTSQQTRSGCGVERLSWPQSDGGLAPR